MWLAGERLLIRAMRLLTVHEEPMESDLIFVLAGCPSRKDYGLKLFYERWAPLLLLSTARFDIRKFARLELPFCINLTQLSQGVPPQERYFFVAVDRRAWTMEQIRKRFWGTLSEIVALAHWMERHREVSSVLIVSSGFHLARVRMCCEAMLPQSVSRRYVPVPEDEPAEFLRNDNRLRKFVVAELFKIPLYALLLWCRRRKPAYN